MAPQAEWHSYVVVCASSHAEAARILVNAEEHPKKIVFTRNLINGYLRAMLWTDLALILCDGILPISNIVNSC